jgi:3-methylfumaryl-CoA hydratase
MAADDGAAASHLERWVGRARETSDTLTAERTRKLVATLDMDVHGPDRGASLPYGWHWIYFHEAVPRSALGEDGHERRGDFLPPVPLDRRMWAGGTLRFVRPLRIGDDVTRISTVRSVEAKEGRSGPLVFVTVEHRIHDAEGVAVQEEQDLVYLNRTKRERGDEDSRSDPDVSAPHSLGWRESFTADEVTLFRFSALTFNGHRIHYDRRYAIDVEGYPDIVVHGPLIALLLLGAGVRWAREADDVGLDADGSLTFRYRARRPVFCGQAVELRGSPKPGAEGGNGTSGPVESAEGVELSAHGPGGRLVMEGELVQGG